MLSKPQHAGLHALLHSLVEPVKSVAAKLRAREEFDYTAEICMSDELERELARRVRW